jgi:HEAT repeat protein
MSRPLRHSVRALAAVSLVLLVGAGEPAVQVPRTAPCSLPQMIDDLRAAMHDGSPALQRYLKVLLKEAALSMPLEELRAAFEAERDPKVLEALGVALATRASNVTDPKLVAPILDRARRDSDPALRAAALGGLRGVGSVEMMEKNQSPSYAQFMRDPAPEVREAVVENLVHEDSKVYFGHARAVSEAAVQAAAACPDPDLAAKLLTSTSMEQVGPEAVGTLIEKLAHENPELRAAAARALGGVSAAQAPAASRALVERYRSETERDVRVAILEGLVHLGLAGARPTLEALRSIDPTLAPEIDAWLRVLAMNLQEWSILLREKQRIQE